MPRRCSSLPGPPFWSKLQSNQSGKECLDPDHQDSGLHTHTWEKKFKKKSFSGTNIKDILDTVHSYNPVKLYFPSLEAAADVFHANVQLI